MKRIGGLVPQGLMRSLEIVEVEVASDPGAGLCNALVRMQVDFFVLDRAPEPLDEDVVDEAAPCHPC